MYPKSIRIYSQVKLAKIYGSRDNRWSIGENTDKDDDKISLEIKGSAE